MKKVAISIGDLNGVGVEIALLAHDKIKRFCEPLYVIDGKLLFQASKMLGLDIPKDFKTCKVSKNFKIKPGKVSKKSGLYSFKSFKKAIDLAKKDKVDAIVTLPINKEAWNKAGIRYKGHTEVLSDLFKKEAIMMIGCKKLFSLLYTQHIPLKDVSKTVKTKKLYNFFIDIDNSLKTKKIAVLGLNPHAGDGGVIGDEEKKIKKAIKKANKTLKKELFYGPLVPDTAFSPKNIKNLRYLVAIYHDQGLIPVKTLYFKESINVSLNLPIVRTSVDHGTAFDIAYKGKKPSLKSYINAVKEAVKLS
ncbi:MAG: 4-hydroxythreonine-4-phosphate dehydrogenase [Epsilonproteobacteria bacterium]|nr:4-hydroxythreonine-4-phosphate dehydrogenase [Campylobacterota bacterium]